MKIGYLLAQHVDIRTPPFSGPANHVREVVTHLQRQGHEVRIIAEIDGRYWQTDDLHQFELLALPWLDNGPLRWLEKGIRRLQSELKLPYAAFFDSLRFGMLCHRQLKEVDILFERMSWMRYGGAIASRLRHIPLVYENNGDHLADLEAKGIAPQGSQRRLSLALTNWMVKQAAHVVVSGDGWQRAFRERWGTPADRITTVENGTILVEMLDRQSLRTFQDLPPRDRPRFIYLGGFYPWQGVPILLKAFAQAVRDGIEAELLLIGSGLGLEAAEKIVADLGLGDRVTFTGRLAPAAYAPQLADADVGLAPYCGWPEYSGLKTFDYKAAGLPTISTGVDGMPATLSDGRTGLIIPPCDEAALSAAIKKLAQAPALRRVLGRRARAEAESEHTWEQTVNRLLSIFADLLPQRRRPESAGKTKLGAKTE